LQHKINHMKNILVVLITCLTVTVSGQERTNTALPVINPVAKGKLTEATGWMQNDEGQWASRKNKIPVNMESQYKSLIDYQHDGLGEDRENFIYYELRDVKIKDSVYSILIKKYRDGFYQYETIKKGWMPQTSINYYVFPTAELKKLQNLAPDITHNIKIKTLYYGELLYLDPKISLTTIAKSLSKEVNENDDFGKKELMVNLRKYKNNIRFIINNVETYREPEKLEKDYYEVSAEAFKKFLPIQ
jgi:hypothetical protein